MQYIIISLLVCAVAFGQKEFNSSELSLIPAIAEPTGACTGNGRTQLFGGMVYVCDTTWKRAGDALVSGIQGGLYITAVSADLTDTYTVTIAGITAYAPGMRVFVKVATANTDTATLNINGIGAATIVRPSGSALLTGYMIVGPYYQLTYDGTNWRTDSGDSCTTGQLVRALNAHGGAICALIQPTVEAYTEGGWDADPEAPTKNDVRDRFEAIAPAGVAVKSASIRVGTPLPATCAPGDTFMLSSATTGQRNYGCESTDTWVLQGDGGGAGGGEYVDDGVGIVMTGAGTVGDPKVISADTAVVQTKRHLKPAGGTDTFTGTVSPTMDLSELPEPVIFLTPDVDCSGASTLNIDTTGALGFFEEDGTTNATCTAGRQYLVTLRNGAPDKWVKVGGGGGSTTGGGTTVEIVTGTTRTLADADSGKVLAFSNAAAIAVTAPAGLAANFSCLLLQWGAGQITVAGSGGATIAAWNSALKTAGQYAQASIVLVQSNAYWLSGNTVP